MNVSVSPYRMCKTRIMTRMMLVDGCGIRMSVVVFMDELCGWVIAACKVGHRLLSGFCIEG